MSGKELVSGYVWTKVAISKFLERLQNCVLVRGEKIDGEFDI
jgi:hypothetical protein